MSEAIIARKLKSILETIYNDIYQTIYNDIYVDVPIDVIVFNPPLDEFVPLSASYTVPANIANNTLTVTLSGAKGADHDTSSGLYGEVITQDITVTPGETIPIYIGNEGTDGANGEPSSFGTYMIANGGLSADNAIGIENIEDYQNENTGGAGYAVIGYATTDGEVVEEVVSNV